MRFSRYKAIFMVFSAFLIIGLYAITFGAYGGFAHSITFDGGIRFSMSLPPGQGKQELEAGMAKAGLRDFQVRMTNMRKNLFDVEFGPGVQESIRQELKKYRGAAGNTNKAGRKKIGSGQKEEKHGDTVVGEIERQILRALPHLTAENIITREAISASYGGNLAGIAAWSLLLVVAIIGLYLSFRFDLPFAIGASLALIHDVVIAIGFIGVLRIEPDIPVVAAVLMIVGYSINDTIVIFDRIRDTMEEQSYAALDLTMDLAITQTLSRTIVTSVLTLLAVLALLFGGAVSLYDFAIVLVVGIVVGTYSSIFIAAHFVQYYEQIRARFR